MSKIKIVGIDFFANQTLNKFIKFSDLDYDSITISMFKFELDLSNAKIKIHTGKNKKFGLDGGSPQLSENLARECHDEIFSALKGAEIIICISDFFGDDGEGIPAVVAEISKEVGALSIFFAIIPNYKLVVSSRQKRIEEFLKKLLEKTDYVIQIDFWYFTKFVSKGLRFDIFMEMCERLTAIDADYFLKNYLKWSEKICELQLGMSKDLNTNANLKKLKISATN